MARLLFCQDCEWRPETVEETSQLHEHHITETETVTVCRECHRKRHGYVKRGTGYVSPVGNENAKTEIIRFRATREQKDEIRLAAERAGIPMSRFILRACLASESSG